MAFDAAAYLKSKRQEAVTGRNPLTASSVTEEKKEKKNKGGVLGGIGYTLGQLGTGVFGVAEGVYDFLVGGVADIIGQEDYTKRLLADDITGRWQQGLDDWYNPSKAMDFVGDVAGGLGQTATYVGLNLIPGAGQALSAGAMFTSAAGRGVTSAYQKTGKLGAKEWIYGFGSGTVEAGLELATGTVGKIAGSIKGVSKNVAKSAVRSGILRSMWDAGKGEFVEESLSELIDPYLQRATIDPNAKNASLQEIFRAGMVGLVSGAVGGAGGTTIGNVGSLNRGKRITKTGNTDFSLQDKKLGERTASSGSREVVLQRAQTLLSKIDNAQNAETVAGNLLALKGSYDAYNKLTNKDGIRGQMLLGEMARNIAYTELSGGVEASKADIKQHAETLAQYLTNQKGQTYTAEDIKNNKDGILTDLAIADFSAKMLIDPDTALTMVKRGESGVLDMASQYEAWRGNLTAEQLQEANTALGIDLSTSTFQDFNKAMGAFNASTQQQQPSIETRKAQAQPLPDTIALQDGETAVYKTESGEYLAVKRDAEGYLVAADDANGNGLGKSAKHLTEEQVNELVKGVKQGKQAPTETSKVKEVKAKMETSALTEEGRSMVKDFDNLPASTQARIREMIATGKQFNTVSQADMEFVANLMAKRSGVSFAFTDFGKGGANGLFTATDKGKRFVQLNANNSSEAIKVAAVHELAHELRKSNAVGYESLSKAALKLLSKEELEEIKTAYTEYYKQKGEDTESKKFADLLDDEYQAHAMQKLFGKKQFLERYINYENKGILEQAKGVATKLANKFKGVFSPAYRQYGKLIKTYEAILAMPSLAEASGESERASLSSMSVSFFGKEKPTIADFESRKYKETEGYKNYVASCVENMRQTRGQSFNEKSAREEIESSIDGIVDVAVAMKKAGYDIIDEAGKRKTKDSKGRSLFSSLEPNSDYITSSDISTICDKRKNFSEIYDEIVKRERELGVPEGKGFFDTVDNYFVLHKILADKGLTQPCKKCYVESMRKNLAPMANAFLSIVRETDAENTANKQLWSKAKNSDEIYVIGRDGKKYVKKTTNTEIRRKVLETLEAHPEYNLSASDLTVEMLSTAPGLTQLRIQAPLIYEYFNSFYGQAKPKMPRQATPFRFGELTAMLTNERGKIKQGLVEQIKSTGGFRLQSYSDFQIENFADVLQVIFEAGTLGLNGHAYTKVPAFLDATAGTNLKRNISIFMYNDGKSWKLDKNDSFPYDLEKIYEIVNKDGSGNTGIIAVVQNDDMAAWVMANDNIGYFIPFHKSGIKMDVVRDTDVVEGTGKDKKVVKGYKNVKDHTKQQSEVWAKTEGDHKANTKVKKGINIYDFWDFKNADGLSKKDLIKKNVKAYINECNRAGYLPKFRDYVMNNDKILKSTLAYAKEQGFVDQNATIDDISFEYSGYRIPYGYYKCLGDFGMFKPNGEASPIKTLSLKNYNFDKAVRYFSNAQSLRRTEILQQIANGEERERIRNSNMTTAEIVEYVQNLRKKVVDEVVGEDTSRLSIPLQDSNGNTLTEAQRNFFKDSKVRDEQGMLLVCNHATADNTFTVFNQKKTGKNSKAYFAQGGALGRGFYFSTPTYAYYEWNNWVEKQTGKPAQSMEVYLNITNPLYYDHSLDAKLKEFLLESVTDEYQKEALERRKTNIELISFCKEWDIDIQSTLKAIGYDGIIEGEYQIVAFEPNQIKLTTNKNPTENPDIRYSIPNIDNYTKKQYNDFGWVRANDVVSASAWKNFDSKLMKVSKKRFLPPKATNGEWMISVSDESSENKGVENIIVFAKGTYQNPKVSQIIKINFNDETSVDIIREYIYERKGTVREGFIDSVCTFYAREDFLRSGGRTTSGQTIGADRQETSRRRDAGSNQEDLRLSIPTNTAVRNKEYMDAVNRNDMETAQRMVDDEAKEAGYTVEAYHGTKSDFTKFSKEKFGANFGNWSLFGAGFYFAPTKRMAEYWGNFSKENANAKVMRVFLRASKMLQANEPLTNDKAINFIKEKSPSFDKEDIAWTLDRVSRFVTFMVNSGYDANMVREFFMSMGYDGVDYSNLSAGKYRQYVVFDPEQIKSADPVTYDDNGNIIPLSERFKRDNEDIRYSIPTKIDTDYINAYNRGNDVYAQHIIDAVAEVKLAESKARDKNGKLLKVYHGSPEEFNVHNRKRSISGIFSATDREVAESFAKYRGGSGIVYEAYVDARNPLIVDALEEIEMRLGDNLIKSYSQKSYFSVPTPQEMRDKGYSVYEDTNTIAKYAEENGYDSVIIYNVTEGSGQATTDVIVFNPEQFKLADTMTFDDVGNLIPPSKRFDLSQDDMRFSISYAPTGKTAIAMTTKEDKRAFRDRVREANQKTRVAFIDAQAAIADEFKRLGVDSGEALIQAARSATSKAQHAIGGNIVDITEFSKNGKEPTVLSKGVAKLMQPIEKAGLEAEFFDYLFNLHNIDRMQVGKSINGKTIKQSQEIIDLIEKTHPEYKEDAKKWAKTSAEKIEKLSQKPGVALNKDFVEYLINIRNIKSLSETKPVNGNTVKESKNVVADYEKAHPEFIEWQKEWAQMVDALMTLRLKAGLITQELYDELKARYPHYVPTFREEGKSSGTAGDILGKYDLSVKRTIKNAKGSTDTLLRPDEMIARQTLELYRAIEQNNLLNALYDAGASKGSTSLEIVSREKMRTSLEKTTTDNIADLETINEDKPNSATNTVTFFKDGEKITLRVSKNIFTGLEALHPGAMAMDEGWLLKGMRKVMNAFKSGVTNLNPFFLVRNAARDIQDAIIYTKNDAGFVKAYPRAYAEMAKNGNLWQLYVAAGGMSSSVFDSHKGFVGSLSDRGFAEVEGNIGKRVLQRIDTANLVVEQLPRFTEFIASIEAGKSVDQAILDSADVTVNFGRSGKITKWLNSYLIPFLNASVQGASKTFRTFTRIKTGKEFCSLVVRCAILGIAPAVLSSIMYDDDEDYQNLRTEDKQNYYLFKVGDKFIKIPRGRLAALLSGVVVRTDLARKGEDDAFKGLGKSTLETLTPVESASRSIFSPFADVKNNVTWYGTAIEGREFDNKAVKDRYDEGTSSIAIALGKLKIMQEAGMSPKKIHYLIDQYAGVLGDIFLPMTTKKAERNPLASNFTVDPITNNKLSTKFYKLYDETTYASSAGDSTAALKLRHFNKVKQGISDLYKQKDEIQASKLSDKEKLARTRIIQTLINEAYKTAIDESELWTKAFADSEGLGTNYSVVEVTKSNYKELEESKETIGSFVIAYNGKTTGKAYETEEKATKGLSSMISDFRFAEGYRLMGGTEQALAAYNTAAYEKAQKLNAAGIDYDSYYTAYMTLKQYSGDASEKREYAVSTIEALDLTKQQRLMLIYALGYSVKDGELWGLTSKAAKTNIARYIRSLKLSNEEKITLAKACGLTVKNGKIVTK